MALPEDLMKLRAVDRARLVRIVRAFARKRIVLLGDDDRGAPQSAGGSSAAVFVRGSQPVAMPQRRRYEVSVSTSGDGVYAT